MPPGPGFADQCRQLQRHLIGTEGTVGEHALGQGAFIQLTAHLLVEGIAESLQSVGAQ